MRGSASGWARARIYVAQTVTAHGSVEIEAFEHGARRGADAQSGDNRGRQPRFPLFSGCPFWTAGSLGRTTTRRRAP